MATPQELAHTFPEALPVVRRHIKALKKELRSIGEQEAIIRNRVNETYKKQKSKDFYLWIYTQLYVEIPQKGVREKLHRLQRIEKLMTTPQIASGSVDVVDVKHVPISEFISFDRTHKAKCIWVPERTPSMHYYKKDNRVHCFGCGKSGDVVDVVQTLFTTDFKGALIILKKYC